MDDVMQMDVLEFFKAIRQEREEIILLSNLMHSLEESLLPAAIRYDRDKVQTSPSDHMLDTAARINEIERDMGRQIDILTQHVQLAHDIINEVPTSECRQLLRLRYLDSVPGSRRPMEWIDIAESLGYSVDYVRGKLHGKAIRLAREIWKREHTGTH